jgi:plastocyanin
MRDVRLPLVAGLIALSFAAPCPAAQPAKGTDLPTGDAAKTLTVEREAPAQAGVFVVTVPLAVKETGPKKTVKVFGETYAFSPAVFAVYRDQPTLVTLRNLQPDDLHDFMLSDPDGSVLMRSELPPLTDTSYVLTFHREGIFPFYCTMHQPAMNGQVIVLPAKHDE